MKISFVATFLTHHQMPLCQNFIDLVGDDYTYIALDPIASEQAVLGYKDLNGLPFVLRAYENSESYEKALDKIKNDDVVIYGSCPNSLIDLRLKNNKLSVFYTERFFKKGTYRRFIPITYYKIYDRILKHKNKNIHIICSSAYAPYDFKLLGYNKPILKWAFFPEVFEYNIDELMSKNKSDKLKILWAGRFIDWKHAEQAIDAVCRLKNAGHDFEFNIIGTGILEEQLKKQAKDKGMDAYTKFLGAIPADKVRKYMEEANIYLFTSDFNEGWGAVLNESMNSGCAVIASHAIGSAPFLIEDGVNGLIYRNNDQNHLFERLKFLADNPEVRTRMGINAYHTMTKLWNAKTAARRLFEYFTAWLNGTQPPVYDHGPCSIAPVLNHRWYK